jgi:hypothetical protein
MKSSKILIVPAIVLFSLALTSCGQSNRHAHNHGHDHDHEHMEAIHHGEGAEFNSAYVCPMHCEGGGSEEAGNCPVCGMEYVLLDDHVKDGHTH